MSWQFEAASCPWLTPTFRDVLCRAVPDMELGDRWLLRALAFLARNQVQVLSGLEHVDPANDPFILALNHSTRREALLVPAVLMLHRGGRLIHFLADWNFRLIPGIGLIYRRAQTITVTRKSARPAVLNLLKPLYHETATVLERARGRLLAGASIGIFPEARVNRDRDLLLKGRLGAAYLSLETGVSIVPAGIHLLDRPTNTGAIVPLEVRIGAPLRPPHPTRSRVPLAELRDWHAIVMAEIARLSGKSWGYARGEQPCIAVPESLRAA